MKTQEIATFVATLPYLSRFWRPKYISQDAQQGFKQTWLNNLTDANFEADTEVGIEKLDRYLGTIFPLPCFNKLGPGMRSKNLDQFYSTVVEIKTLAWLMRLGLLKEIRPRLPVGTGESDFRIDLQGEEIYGEVWQPRILPDEWLVKTPDMSIAVADQRSEAPRRLHTLRGKGDSQLPSEVKGVWVAHIYYTALRRAWTASFRKDMTARPNVLGVAIWTSSGSRRLASEGALLKRLDDDEHEVYWVHNEATRHKTLEQHLLRVLKG